VDTTLTQATYDGDPGHTYTFHVTATDHVANAAGAEVEAITRHVTKYYYFDGQRVAMRTPDDEVVWLHGDHLGSTSLATSEGPSPTVVGRQLYKPFGEVRWASGALETDFGFTGQREDGYIRLVHMGARWYNRELGRWVSPDSLVPDTANPQSLNRYSYLRHEVSCAIVWRGSDQTCRPTGSTLRGHAGLATASCEAPRTTYRRDKVLAAQP
jgi:RHS repeat-associated protein